MQFFVYSFAVTYFLEVYQLFGMGSTGFTLSDTVTVMMFFYFVKRTIWDGVELTIPKNPAILFLLLFFIATIISGLAPILRGKQVELFQYLKSMSHYHFSLLFVTINILMNNKNETWDKFIKFWLGASLFINIFGIYQIFARGLNLPFAWMDIQNVSYLSRGMYDAIEEVPQFSSRFENFFRATSVFSEPSALAGFDGFILVFILLPYIQNIPHFFKSKLLNVLIFVFCVLGLLLTFSLTGFACVVMILLGIVLFEKFKNLGLFFKIFFIMIFFVLIADQFLTTYTDISVIGLFQQRLEGVAGYITTSQLSNLEGESFSGRSESIGAMFNIFRHNPIFGTGLGLTFYSPYADGWHFADVTIMAVLAETGFIGFIGYFGFFIVFIMISIKFLINRNNSHFNDIIQKRLLLSSFYVLMVYFVVNYLSGNQIVNVFSLIVLSMLFNIFGNYYKDNLGRYYKVKLVPQPMSTVFKSRLNYFMNQNTN